MRSLPATTVGSPKREDASGGLRPAIELLEPRRLLSSYALNVLASLPPIGPAFSGSKGDLVVDNAGNVYGIAPALGPGDSIFEIARGSNSLTTLASFGPTDDPEPGLIIDGAGDLFGTTLSDGGIGPDTIFELPRGGRSILTIADFDSYQPNSGLTIDAAGNIFGTGYGDAFTPDAIFELPNGTHTIKTLATWDQTEDLNGGLAIDRNGDLFGTTFSGDVIELASGSHMIATLASLFGEPGLESGTGSSVILDSRGDLFGSILNGGEGNNSAVYELARDSSTITTLASFNATDDGPIGGLTADPAGDFFGSTSSGGAPGYGSIFELSAGSGTITTLATFAGADGNLADGALALGAGGTLYGVSTDDGPGSGPGAVFELVPGGASVPFTSVPFAELFAADITTAGTMPQTVTATYTDGTGIRLSSISQRNIEVIGPDGSPLAITGVTATPATGSPEMVTATYTVDAPPGGWTAADSGNYMVTLKAGQVANLAGQTVPSTSTTFDVNVLPAGTLGIRLLLPGYPVSAIVPGKPAATVGIDPIVQQFTGVANAGPRIQVEIENPSAHTVRGQASVTVFVPSQPVLTGATPVGTLVEALNLRPGQHKVVRVPVIQSTMFAPGTYTFLASVTNPDGSTSATVGPGFFVEAPLVMVTASSPQPLASRAAPGEKVVLELSISNAGNETVDGKPTLTVSVYPMGSADSAVQVAAVRLKVRLKTGASRLYKVRFTLPASLTAGSYGLSTSLGVNALGDTDPSDGMGVSASAIPVT